MAIVISDVNALQDFIHSEILAEVLAQYKDSEHLSALFNAVATHPHWFPLVLIGKGSSAWVFQTPKGTALRLSVILFDNVIDRVDPNGVADLTAHFYQQCAAQNNNVELFPQIYHVSFPSSQSSIVEMEKLEPMQRSPLFLKYSFMKKWENAQLDGMPTDSILFQGWLSHQKELESLSPENVLSLLFSLLYNVRSLTEYKDSYFVNAIRDLYPEYISTVSDMLKKFMKPLNIPNALDEVSFDVHVENIMYRPGKNQLVLIDPIVY